METWTHSNPEKEDRKRRIVSLFFSLLYGIGIILLFFLFKIATPPIEKEEGEGLLVDFGYSDVGMGDNEPGPKENSEQVSIPAPGNPPFTQTVKEEVIVQDEEITESVDIPKKEEKKKIVVVENLLKKNNKSNEISKSKAESNSEEKPTETKIEKKALFTGFSGKGSGNGSQGNKEGEGNMGDPSGSKSSNYIGQNTGLGNNGPGKGLIGSGLKGRKLDNIPKIVDNSNKEGKIIIKVQVDAQGKVINSTFQAQGSTLTDSDLINKCIQTAKKAKFTANEERETDYGTLVFKFSVR
jgi:outer membrane biosynthesis protein TonB